MFPRGSGPGSRGLNPCMISPCATTSDSSADHIHHCLDRNADMRIEISRKSSNEALALAEALRRSMALLIPSQDAISASAAPDRDPNGGKLGLGLVGRAAAHRPPAHADSDISSPRSCSRPGRLRLTCRRSPVGRRQSSVSVGRKTREHEFRKLLQNLSGRALVVAQVEGDVMHALRSKGIELLDKACPAEPVAEKDR